MTRSHDLDHALRTLDVAEHHIDPTGPRARSDLHRIVSANPAPAQLTSRVSGTAARPRSSARTVRRVALAAGVVTVVATTVVAVPALTGGDRAFASWTRSPQGLSTSERTDAAASCRAAQQDGPNSGYAQQLDDATLAVADRRGVWTTVVLAGSDGFAAMCITDSSTHLFAHDMIGSVGTSADYTPLAPRELLATDLGTGTMSAGDISLAAGAAGSDVVGVIYHSRTHGDVAATVAGGRFALWFPGAELKDTSARNPVTVEVRYRDGTTGTARLSL